MLLAVVTYPWFVAEDDFWCAIESGLQVGHVAHVLQLIHAEGTAQVADLRPHTETQDVEGESQKTGLAWSGQLYIIQDRPMLVRNTALRRRARACMFQSGVW